MGRAQETWQALGGDQHKVFQLLQVRKPYQESVVQCIFQEIYCK